MTRNIKTKLFCILFAVLCATVFLMPAALALEDGENYIVAADTPFSSVTNNGTSYRLTKTERLEDGSYRITQDTAVESTTRMFYGEGATPYGVDLTNFSMKFAFDRFISQAGVYGGFSISLQRNADEFPMDNYMVGFSIYFADIGNAFEMILYLHNAQGQSELSRYYLVYNNNGRPDCTGKTITLTIGNEEGNTENLLLDLRYEIDAGTTENDMVPFRAQISKSSLAEAGLDISNATLFFAPRSGLDGDLVYTIKSIEDPNTNAYLAAPERQQVLSKLDALEAAMADFDSYGAYESYLRENSIDPTGLRAYDRVQHMAFFDPAYKALLESLIPADAQVTEGRSNYTTSVRNNQDGSYAEVLQDGREKLILVNDFKVDGSSLGLKKTVDIRDFSLKFTIDRNFENARFTLLFGPTPDCYNFGSMTIPGIAITLMGGANGFNIILENAAGAKPVDGIPCDQYHVLVDETGNWVTLPYAAENEICLTLTEEEDQSIRMTCTSGGQIAEAVFSKTFLDAGQLDVSQMYFKLCAGHQAMPFGSGYLELTVNQISDAANDAAVEKIQSFLTSAAENKTAEGAVELLAEAPESGELYFQQSSLIQDLESALIQLKAVIESELTEYVNAFALSAEKIKDTSVDTLTQENVLEAQAAQDAFYDRAEWLDLLTVSQINKIRETLDAAEYTLEKAQLYLRINDYVTKAQTLGSEDDVLAAQAVRETITDSSLSFLNEEDLAAANTILTQADQKVSEGEITFAKHSCVSASVGQGIVMAVVFLLLGSILFLKKKKA